MELITHAERALREAHVQMADAIAPSDNIPALPESSIAQEASSKRPTSKRKIKDYDPESEDELATGLPKEQYQPRPSKSRSSRVAAMDEEHRSSSDGRAKRRKTADTAHDDKKVALVDMGFRSSQAERALIETDGNAERAADWLLDGGQASGPHDEAQAENSVVPKEMGMGSKIAVKIPVAGKGADDNLDWSGPYSQENNIPSAHELSDKNTEKSSKSDRGEDKESGRRDRPVEEPAVKAKKKKRGRPRKQAAAEEVVEVEVEKTEDTNVEEQQADPVDTSNITVDEGTKDSPQVARDDERIDTDASKSIVHEKQANGGQGHAQIEPAASPSLLSKTILVKAGKVPLRVGLSKRMKIPSLLSSAKKG